MPKLYEKNSLNLNILNNDHDDFENYPKKSEVFNRAFRFCVRVAARYVPNSIIEDCAQEAIINTLNAIDRRPEVSTIRPYSYLATVVKRIAHKMNKTDSREQRKSERFRLMGTDFLRNIINDPVIFSEITDIMYIIDLLTHSSYASVQRVASLLKKCSYNMDEVRDLLRKEGFNANMDIMRFRRALSRKMEKPNPFFPKPNERRIQP